MPASSSRPWISNTRCGVASPAPGSRTIPIERDPQRQNPVKSASRNVMGDILQLNLFMATPIGQTFDIKFVTPVDPMLSRGARAAVRKGDDDLPLPRDEIEAGRSLGLRPWMV